MQAEAPRARRAVVTTVVTTLIPTLGVAVALPLALYYVLRWQGVAQWQALLLSSVPPVIQAVVEAVRHRRARFFDLLVVVLLLVSAVTSLISGDPRVLLLKDAALPAVLGLWIAGTLLAARPFAFQFGRQLRSATADESAERRWRRDPEFRRALRSLTLLWGAAELLDAALSVVEAVSLPVDVVPVIGRSQSLGILALVVIATVRRSRRFRERHGVPLFGLTAEATGEPPVPGTAPDPSRS
ncbi:VC0807 family protein [Streptomyces caatingaensis]|uniref:VC0807 family protein n=1 Tax=Streptomyces caatingaensis TaxID=1678637 RepID=UPI00069F0B7B|nr:VC0807 family protein [Streptomyces caatingaensis]